MNQSAIALGTVATDNTAVPGYNEHVNGIWMDVDDDNDDEEEYALDILHEGGKYMDAVELAMEGVIPSRFVNACSYA